MAVVCHRPEGLEQLEAQTNFTKRELQVLYRGFKNVSASPPHSISVSKGTSPGRRPGLKGVPNIKPPPHAYNKGGGLRRNPKGHPAFFPVPV